MTDKRQYVRMKTVFPVEIEIFQATGEKESVHLLQAFTRDISPGGMCLELKVFRQEIERQLLTPNVQLALTINPSFSKHPIKAIAKIAWMKRQEDPPPLRYLIGVSYTEIDEKKKAQIIRHAKYLLWLPRILSFVGLCLISSLVILFFRDQKLIIENRAIVQQLVETAEKESAISGRLYEFQRREAVLNGELDKSQGEIKKLESSIASLAAENIQQKENYQKELNDSLEKQRKIDEELKYVAHRKEMLEAKYQVFLKEHAGIQSTGLQQMVDWLKTHRNLRTGLIASFEGDPSLEGWAFTYDQSLACQVFLIFGDLKSAEGILSFYANRASKAGSAFYNAYDTTDGRAVENTVHVGPNAWLGIAALQYDHRTDSERFLPLAKNLGDWIMGNQDAEGGLKGGPSMTWYSTEHNLDAYAFLLMLYQETREERYRESADKVLDWIVKYAYSSEERRINRGKGDATIATDTFSWAVAALGPAKLTALSLNPEEIMEYVERHCEVTVNYTQPEGKTMMVKGFDFARAQNVGRGGVISTEWTAQVIVTYQILAHYFNSLGDKEKALQYLQKSDFYLNELQKLVITSPSRTGQGRGCLPYASIDNADTGHGWRTPKGQRTGSVAGTAYGIFAWMGYNPFSFNERATYGTDISVSAKGGSVANSALWTDPTRHLAEVDPEKSRPGDDEESRS